MYRILADGTQFLSGSWDNSIKLWDINTGRLLRTVAKHNSPGQFPQAPHIYSIAVSSDGKRVVSGGIDNNVKMWDISSGRLLQTFLGHTATVHSVAFSPDDAYIISGSDDHTLKLWDANTGTLLHTLGGQSSTINVVSLSQNGDSMVAGSDDKSAKLWDIGGGRLLQLFEKHDAPVAAVAISLDGSEVLAATNRGQNRNDAATMRVWNIADGKLLREIPDDAYLTSIAYSLDRRLAATGRVDSTVRIWDLANGKPLHTLKISQRQPSKCYTDGSPCRVSSISFSPDSSRLVTGSEDSITRVWDVSSGKLLQTFPLNWGYITAVGFSPDGTHVLNGNLDGGTRLWSIESGKLLHLFDGDVPVSSVAFTTDGAHVTAGSWDGLIKLWETQTGRLVHTFSGHSGKINSLAITPDNRVLLSGGDDTTIRAWGLATGELLATFISGTNGEWLVITPEGFFNASSPKASELLSVVRGLEAISPSQIFEHLYRPDLVQAKLKGDLEGKYKDAAHTINVDLLLDSGPAPQIEWSTAPTAGAAGGEPPTRGRVAMAIADAGDGYRWVGLGRRGRRDRRRSNRGPGRHRRPRPTLPSRRPRTRRRQHRLFPGPAARDVPYRPRSFHDHVAS